MSCIGASDTQEWGEHECGRVRGRRRVRGRGIGQVRGSGRCRFRGRGQGNNPYSLTCSYGNGTFIPEAKIYDKIQYHSFPQNQQTEIQKLKSADGWINGYTPPNRYVLGDKLYSTLSMSLISAVQHHISHTRSDTNTHSMVPLSPTPSHKSPIPPIINTNSSQVGATFGRQVF